MRNKWHDRSCTEKACFMLYIALLAGTAIFYLIYFVQHWRPGKDIAWMLFCLHFFAKAAANWKVDHNEAIRSLCLGCFLALMLSPILLAYIVF